MKTVRVNVACAVNAAKVRKEKRNGRDVIVVPSATLPDNVVMNGVLYPADEIAKSYKSLENTPAPFGHPMINGKFVSASQPEGLNRSYIGAWNENVRRENGRVFLDKVIDVEVAGCSDDGKAVLNAIEAAEPVHTSTGLLMQMEPAVNGEGYKHIARNMVFDHDAIMLGQSGAATPDQGVGMMVNSAGDSEEVEVINASLEDAEKEVDWAGQRLLDALTRRDQASVWEAVKARVIEAFKPEREAISNKKEANMSVSEEQFNALSAKVDTLSEAQTKLPDTITTAVNAAVKPLIDAQAEMKANADARLQIEVMRVSYGGDEDVQRMVAIASRLLALTAH